MASRLKTASLRRRPQQRRARETVDSVLDAVIRILKHSGPAALTTNRIAEVAGVSIGSVYQYFPDKRAIFTALHERHIQQIDRVIQGALVEHARSSLEDLMRAIIDAMVEAHTTDPELYEMLLQEVPHRADGSREFSVRLHGVFLLAISSRARELKKGRDLDSVVFVVTHMVDALSHGAILRRPATLSLAAAKEEIVRAVMAYLRG
jgi:AcrR family transcriptional regulator